MTKKKASFILMLAKNRVCDNELNEALDMAIKALNQEPVLDKIRAEIENLEYLNIEDGSDGYDKYIEQSEVLNIIDKYKEESEE